MSKPLIAVSLMAGCLLAVLAYTPAPADAPTPQDEPDAGQILNRMAETYAQCKTYRDSGTVTTVFIEAQKRRTDEKPFTTAFVRPDRFRFEYQHHLGVGGILETTISYVVCRNADKILTWWDARPEIKENESLGRALAGATGISGGSAHTVPALLIPDEVGGWRLNDITEPKRIEDAIHDNSACLRIQGTFIDHPMTIWIDRESFLVRRIDQERQFDDFRTEETTIYEPVIDEDIPDELLDFGYPKED